MTDTASDPKDALDLKDWRFSIDSEGIAWATFDREGESMNSLGRRPIEELGAIVERVEAEARAGRVKGLVIISGKERGFIVGADIREFEHFKTEADVIAALNPVNAMLDRIERMSVPVVAAVHGVCVGGGLELILACHYRIGTRDDGTRVGFPEVKLGIFPGFNGTARSIRQVGPVAAMQNMLTGSMIRATAAKAIGFFDQLVNSPGELHWAARKAVLQKRKSKPAGVAQVLMTKQPARGFLAKKMREETAKKAREDHYPAPYRLIDLFERHGGNLDAMKAAETKAFAPLMLTDTARNLRRVFRLTELLKGQAPKKLGWKPSRVHVIGAGTMGADIAGVCVAAGMEVTLQDINAAQLEKGIASQGKLFSKKFKTKALKDAAKARLIADPEGKGVARADVVIEAIVEKTRHQAEAVCRSRRQGQTRRGSGDQHLVPETRRHRRAVERPGPSHRPALLLARAADAAGGGGAGRDDARGGSEEGCGLRHGHRQVPAHHQGCAGVPRQQGVDAVHVQSLRAFGEGRGQGEDRRSGAHVRHADGSH